MPVDRDPSESHETSRQFQPSGAAEGGGVRLSDISTTASGSRLTSRFTQDPTQQGPPDDFRIPLASPTHSHQSSSSSPRTSAVLHRQTGSSGSPPKTLSIQPGTSPTACPQHIPPPFSPTLEHFDETPIQANESEVGGETDEIYHDEVYGSGEETDTDTLPAEIFNYRYLNGRRYHAFRGSDSNWALPNDEKEQERLDLHHHVFLLLLDGELFRAPIGTNPHRILDVGTGTGLWAMDVADMYPSAEVIGTDISAIQPEWVPPNCEFQIADCEEEWTFAKSSFDLVHIRNLAGIKDWSKLICQSFDHIKPGGYLELQECPSHFYSDDDSIPPDCAWNKSMEKFYEAADKAGLQFSSTSLMKGMLEDAGFMDVEQMVLKIPIGPWPANKKLREIGKYHLLNIYDAVESYSLALFINVLGMSSEEALDIINAAKKDLLNPKIHMYMPVYFIHGRKPEFTI